MLSKPYRSLLILMFSLIPEFALAGMFDLPSMVTQKAIQNLSEVTKPPTDQTLKSVETKALKVDPKDLHSNDPAKTTLDANGKADVPFVAPNSMLLQFQADTTQAEIDDFISSKKLEVVKTFPNLVS
jgi:hypothetical protein